MIELIHGDCLKIMSDIPDKSIDMVLCDPPYRTTKRGVAGSVGGLLKRKNFTNGKGGFENNDLNISQYLPHLYRIMKNKAHGYIMCNDKNLVQFHVEILKNNFKIYKTLIWSKNNCLPSSNFMNSHEYIIFFRKGKSKIINTCSERTVFNIKNIRNKLHPTEKPIQLLKKLILASSNVGDIVLDFCMGSGSTGVAAKSLSRNFIGIEIDKKYYEIAKERIKERR